MSRRPRFALALCLFTIGAAIAGAQSTKATWLSLSTDPGSYRTDIVLSLSSTEEGSLQYRLPGTPEGRFIAYRDPILLTALPGEEQQFPLHIQLIQNGKLQHETEISYFVDKRAPRPPFPSLKPGYYREQQQLTFVPENGVQIHAWISAAPEDRIERVWDGKPIVLTQDRSLTTSHLVLAYSTDAAGNQSALSSFRYFIGPASNRIPSLKVVSPVPGSFANQQLLDIQASGVSDVRYTLDGSDPLTKGKEYAGPTLIPGTGRIALAIAAVPEGTNASQTPDTVLRKQVVFEQMSGDPLRLTQSSGRVIHSALSLDPIPDAHYTYLVDDAATAADALPFSAPITLSPTAGSLNTFVLRLLPHDASKVPESRYTFILDGRVPAKPVIDVDYSLAHDGVPLVTIDHNPQTQVYFTADGTQPDLQSNLYVAQFYPAAADRPVVIKARARFDGPSGAWSETVTQPVKIDNAVPPAPKAFWVSATDASTSSAFFRVEASDADSIRYEIQRSTSPNDGPVAADAAQSFASWPLLPASRDIPLSVPYGTSERVKLTFVDESRSGIMSAPVSLSATLDAVPPVPPAISVHTVGDSATVDLTGNETLLASVSSSPGDAGADTHGFVPLAEPKTATGSTTGAIKLSG
ncbi:MAG TPA: chitobiase/beta-hexosaminidase C-terminal domain-containing protein, partial [Spirochaetia bacterium]|nr:chitobiase/beta-hexosaminidase C-terminal domain-containing protein [Spirochaetia bacterium]